MARHTQHCIRGGRLAPLLTLPLLLLLPSLALAFFAQSEAESTRIKAEQEARLAELAVEQQTGLSLGSLALVHGLVAWFAIGALLPLGMFAGTWSQSGARKGWMHTHWAVHVLATLLIIGSTVVAAVYLWHPPATSAHGVLGLLTVVCLVGQVLQGGVMHLPIPDVAISILVGVHRVWALLLYVVGSVAVITGLVLFAQEKGEGMKAVIGVSVIQLAWTGAVVGAMVYLYWYAPCEGEGEEKEAGAPRTPKWTPVDIEAPIDLDGPLAVSWQKTPKGEGETKMWERVTIP